MSMRIEEGDSCLQMMIEYEFSKQGEGHNDSSMPTSLKIATQKPTKRCSQFMESPYLLRTNMNDQDQVTTTSKATFNQDETNEPTGGLQVMKTVIDNQVKSTPTTPNTTSDPAIDRGNLSNCPIENLKDLNDINESTFQKIVNQASIASENKDTTCEDNPLFISDQLAFQIAKAQESLFTSNSSNLGSKYSNHDSHPDPPAQVKYPTLDCLQSDPSKDSNQPDDLNQSQQLFLPASNPSSSNNTMVSPTSASTDSLSYSSAMISISQSVTIDQPNSAGVELIAPQGLYSAWRGIICEYLIYRRCLRPPLLRIFNNLYFVVKVS
ncbi:hypothetical protein DFH28DRAFT_936248 [Melampsora americana]|nr:hypothetical protein DFH28DRAFT_936248 [Melampsora americana]